MNPDQIRTLGAKLVIVTAICGGLYVMIADPMRSTAHDAEIKLSSFLSENNGVATTLANLPEILESHDQTLRRAAEYEERSRPARDQSVMFAQVMDIAEQAHVVVESVTPNGESASDKNNRKAEALRPGDTSVKYAISGRGSYGATASFLQQLQNNMGCCIVKNFSITPDYTKTESDGLQFAITIELIGFDASPLAISEISGEGSP